MTHFLVLEKGAPLREAERGEREQPVRGRPPSRARLQEPAPAAVLPAFLFLMLPSPDGYRVLRASLEEVVEVPGSEMPGPQSAEGSAELLERLLTATNLAHAQSRTDHPRARAGAGSRTSVPLLESFGDIEIDVAARVVTRRDEVVPLAPLEFDLLLALVRRRGAAGSRRELLREAWGITKTVSLRTVDTHVSNLRRKIEIDPARPRHILTVKKVGYRLQR